MPEKQKTEIKKSILNSIQALADLDSDDFKKGVVDMLELLYEQDVGMTNVNAERLDKVEGRLELINAFMLGIHIATLQNLKGNNIGDDLLRQVASIYKVDFYKAKKVIEKDNLIEDFDYLRKLFMKKY